MAVQCPTGDARNFLVVDDGLPVLRHGDHSPDQRDVIRLPFSRLSRQFRRGREKTVNASRVMARRLLNGVGFDLHFVAAAEIHAAVRIRPAIEFDMQLEVFEFRIVNQLRTIPRRDQLAIFDFPYLLGIWFAHLPAREIFSVE